MAGTTNLNQDDAAQTANSEHRFNAWYIFAVVVWEVVMLTALTDIVGTGGYFSFVALAIGVPSALYVAAIVVLQWLARGAKQRGTGRRLHPTRLPDV